MSANISPLYPTNLVRRTPTLYPQQPPTALMSFDQQRTIPTQFFRELYSMTMQAVTSTAQAVASESKQVATKHNLDDSLRHFVQDMLKILISSKWYRRSETIQFFKKTTKIIDLTIYLLNPPNIS